MISIDQRRIDCIFDADDVGRLPEAVCRALGSMVCELVNDDGECVCPEIAQEVVKVTLRRRGTTYLCTISRRCADSRICAAPRLRRARQIASGWSGRCLVRPMPERRITAIMFDVDLDERLH